MTLEKDPQTNAGAATTGRESGRAARILAVGVGVGFLILVASFVAIPLLAPDQVTLQTVGPVAPGPGMERGGRAFAGRLHPWEITGEVTVDAERWAQVSFEITPTTGNPAPTGPTARLVLDMPDHAMESLEPALSQKDTGAYHAQARLPMDGRWRLHVLLPEGTGVFDFDVIP